MATGSSAGEQWGNEDRRSIIGKGNHPLLLLIRLSLHRFLLPQLLSNSKAHSCSTFRTRGEVNHNLGHRNNIDRAMTGYFDIVSLRLCMLLYSLHYR